VTSSCEAGRSEIDKEVWRRKGMRDFSRRSLLSFFFKSFRRNFKETHNCTAYEKWGVKNLKAPLDGIFHSSPVLPASRQKPRYHCAWLVYLSGVKPFKE